MKYHNKNILCLEYSEYLDCFNAELYKSDKKRGKLTLLEKGGNGREALIEYETLADDRKQAIIKFFGNPYEYITKKPLVDYVKLNKDEKAEQFYNKFALAPGKRLPVENVIKYTQCATWLNALDYFTTDKRALKDEFNISIAAFWQIAGDLIRTKNIGLPINERRLKDKLSQYKKPLQPHPALSKGEGSMGEGSVRNYECLIEAWRFGNDNSAKVKDPVAEALLVEMLAHAAKHDDTIIAAKYNEWALLNKRQAITPAAVGYWRKQKAHLITLSRDGAAANYNKFSKRILRDRPSAPMLLVNSDDNILDLFFKQDVMTKDGKVVANDFYRPAAYVIMDAYNDYILGFAIGNTVTIDLIRKAYLNAIHHVMELCGGVAYLPFQIQTDRWSIGKESELTKFFESLAVFTPATAKVAQSKYIERAFGTTWHQQLKFFPNYSGHNITAKERVNPDAVQLARKDYPHKSQAPAVVAQFIERMRQTINPKTGIARQTEWLQAFAASEKSKQKQIDTEKRLQLFGLAHPYKDRLTAAGLTVEISKQRYHFEIPNEQYLEAVGSTVQVTYDPYDMSQVLISDGRGFRLVVNQTERMPAAIADFKPDTGKKLHAALEFKKDIQKVIANEANSRLEVLSREGINAASVLQAGVKLKAISHDAQKVLTGGVSEPEEELDDFNWRDAM